jgi:hypothetical protein
MLRATEIIGSVMIPLAADVAQARRGEIFALCLGGDAADDAGTEQFVPRQLAGDGAQEFGAVAERERHGPSPNAARPTAACRDGAACKAKGPCRREKPRPPTFQTARIPSTVRGWQASPLSFAPR